MEPLRLVIAIVPLGVYLMALGLVHSLGRPIVVGGARDTASLAIALGGFVIVGPVELFMPVEATLRFGPVAWLMMLTFYALLVLWIVLSQRPRLVIYNATMDEIRHALSTTIARLDPTHRWAGRAVTLPQLRLELHVRQAALMRTVTITSLSGVVDPRAWQLLTHALVEAVGRETTSSESAGHRMTVVGVALLVAGLAVTAIAAAQWFSQPDQLAQQLWDMLRL